MVHSADYIKFRRLGLKAYNLALQHHKDPYLPVLEEIEPKLDALSRVQLGIIQIPVERIVGTVTRGRSNAFAYNFMPLLEPGSEFASKWAILFRDVAEDGLRQPITVVEYMNSYYIIEGNKRVSVMKCLDAPYVEADVTRYLPKRTDEPENKLYFEYLDFYKATQINTIWFSQPGSFKKLTKLTGHKLSEKWSDEDRMDLKAAHMYFSGEYKKLFPESDFAEIGDAFLTYIVAYGYNNVREKSSEQLKSDLRALKTEFIRRDEGEAVNLIMEPGEEKAAGLISAIFRPSKIKAAFLYTRPPRESGWNYWHDIGRINAENALGDRLETCALVLPSRDAFEEEIDSLIKEGNRIVFATSPVMLNSCIRPSIEHPEAKILCCSLLAGYSHVRSYYLRIYEIKFIMGMIAGMLCKNGKIGYVADYPIFGSAASVNAFAIGARMVNPEARIYLEWSTRKGFNPMNPFKDDEIKIISNRDINAPAHASLEYGLYTIENGGIINHAVPVLDWGRFYEAIIESVLNGSFDDDQNGNSALDYWWGMSGEALDVVLSTRFDPYAARFIENIKSAVANEYIAPFEGEIKDQNGILRCTKDKKLTPAEILCMDYLTDSIIGTFPTADELTEAARPITRLQGFNGELKPDISQISWTQR